MSNFFTSFENITLLFNDLMNSKNDFLPLKHISKLLNDFSNLLKEFNYYGMEIKIGMSDDVEIFKVHSTIFITNYE